MLENTEIAVDALTNYDLFEQVDNDFVQNFVSSEFIALKRLVLIDNDIPVSHNSHSDDQ